MEFDDVVTSRRMVRRFLRDPVPADVLTRLLRNATRGPSAGNSEGYAFLVLEAENERDRFWRALAPAMPVVETVRDAPALVVVLASEDAYLRRYARPDKNRPERSWPVPYWHVDAGMAALLMLLTAVDEGLGALFFGVPAPVIDVFRAEFGVPAEYLPVGTVAVGYRNPDSAPSRPSQPRRAWTDLVHHGQWGAPAT